MPDFRPGTPKRFGPVPRYEDLPAALHGRAAPTKEIKLRKPKKATPKARPKKNVTITYTGSGPLIDPDTGRAYTPMSRSDLLKAMEGRQWTGDAADAMFTPCARCGGACGTGAQYVAPWRAHRRCPTTAEGRVAAAVLALLGQEITRTDARLISSTVPVPAYRDLLDSQPHTDPGRQPWQHVSKRRLRKAVQSLPKLRAEAGLTPHPCASGPCAWCSVRLATGWVNEGHKWSDGTPAPLCGTCSRQWVARGGLSGRLSKTYYDEQRAAGWNVLIGRDLPMGHGPDPAFRLYAEVAPDDHPGTDQRFGYISAARRPGTPEFLERVEQEQTEAVAAVEERRSEQVQADEQQSQTWGYGVTT